MRLCRKVWNARWGKDPYSSNNPNKSKKKIRFQHLEQWSLVDNDCSLEQGFAGVAQWNQTWFPFLNTDSSVYRLGDAKLRIYLRSWTAHTSWPGAILALELKRRKTLLTVQEDVVTFTPAAPQRRVMLAGAAHLDGVVHSRLQVQRRPGFSKHRHDLKTWKRKPVGGGWDSQGSISSPIGVTVTCQAGWAVSGAYRTSYLTPVWKFGSVQCRISSASMVCTCERLTGGAGFTGQQKNDHVCYQVLQGLLSLWPPLWLGLLLLVFLGFSVGLFCWWILWVKSQFCISEEKSQFFFSNVLSLCVYFGDTGRASANANCPFWS